MVLGWNLDVSISVVVTMRFLCRFRLWQLCHHSRTHFGFNDIPCTTSQVLPVMALEDTLLFEYVYISCLKFRIRLSPRTWIMTNWNHHGTSHKRWQCWKNSSKPDRKCIVVFINRNFSFSADSCLLRYLVLILLLRYNRICRNWLASCHRICSMSLLMLFRAWCWVSFFWSHFVCQLAVYDIVFL